MPTRYLRYRCVETGRVCFLDTRGQNYWCPYHGDHKLERTVAEVLSETDVVEVPSETDVVEETKK